MTDEQLVLLAQGGDKEAETELLERYSPLAKAISARFFIRGGTAEDLFQEAMVGLYSAIGTYVKEVANFKTYAYRCIRNSVIDAVKKSLGSKYMALNNSVPILEVTGEISPAGPDDELILREQRGEFLRRISAILSSLEFKVIVMHLDGLGVQEIAATLSKPAKSVTNALARAKNKLLKSYYDR